MPTRKFNPTSPGRRHMSVEDFAEVTRSEPEASLCEPLKKSGYGDYLLRIAAEVKQGQLR